MRDIQVLLSQVPGYFKARRNALTAAHPEAVFLFPSNHEVIRNQDVSYPFRQESSFYYLTGFEEPESFLVLCKAGMFLFTRRKDPDREMWEGERYGTEGAKRVFGAVEAFEIGDLDRKLPELLQGAEKVYFRMGVNATMDRRILGALEQVRKSAGRSGFGIQPIYDPQEILGEMRIYKSKEEVEALRKACSVTAQVHRTAMRDVRPGMNESDIEALVNYGFRKGGCQRLGYDSIVAGGVNAACLHYRFNNQPLNDGELLLVDAGGEYDYYTSDITRTYPIGKRFTSAQAKVYDLVLQSQKEAISLAKPESNLIAIHQRACEVLVEGMLSLGLLHGKREEILKSGEYKRFYPHNTSHWLGMDVHDVGLYKKNGEPRPFEPGMVFTIEPGFYVQPGDREVAREYHKIGIRIEDDILITPTGHEVLTHEAPKERAEIEALKEK